MDEDEYVEVNETRLPNQELQSNAAETRSRSFAGKFGLWKSRFATIAPRLRADMRGKAWSTAQK
jgi:hypothetical protein